ncbi:MAG: IS21 family transposase [Nanoarchaeota archaeon]|nr:IS21 family transposase [Nanoarchaeota archaeon]
MIQPEEVMNIKSLRKQGYSIRAISRMAGLHRDTVDKYLEEGEIPIYKKINRQSKLDTFKPLIEGWLSQENYQASRIHELLICEGFEGSYDVVQRHVKTIKAKRDRAAYVRFETIPGQQAQVDFADFKIKCANGTELTIYCFVMVLGYSRHMYVELIDKCTMTNFLACHQHAFGFFGGIPAEILYDNMKNVVIKRMLKKIQWNKEFEAFAMHYGFKPILTPTYSPWAKGKVERPIKYVRERFWRGYVFTDIGQANINIRQWINTVAIERIHGTTKEKVQERFNRERPYLGSLPHRPYDISEKARRKVYKDCQLSFGANRYVIAHECVGKKVLLKIRDGIIRIFDDDQMIAVYKIPPGKGQVIENPKFYQRLRKDKEQLRKKYRKPYGKAKATRGLVKHGMQYEVMRRSLSEYDL